jgi:DNA polymerase III subunit delta
MPARSDFDRHLDKEPLLPVYALVGSESVLVAEAVTALRQRALTRAPDFNRHEFSGREALASAIIEAASTLPMMAERRFVHVSELQQVKAKEQQALAAYLDNPAPQTVLCLSGDKVDQRTKLGQALGHGGFLFAFEPPRQQELPAWIERRAKKQGHAIERDAAQLLADLVGAEVGTLDRALDKLALHAGEGTAIRTSDVEASVAPTRVHSIFELTDAIGSRDLGKASLLLRNALGGGESGLPILGMITRQFRQVLQVKSELGHGVQPRELSTKLGIRPFLVDSLVAQARRYSEAELYRALDAALRADIRLKSSRLDAGVVLDRLLVEAIGRATP